MQFAVIGLGKFGLTAALELQQLNNRVTGIDLDEKEVEKLSSVLSYAVIADSTDKGALEELNIADYDGVLVSIGDDLEASLLTTLNLQSLNVKNIWVKAKSQAHATVLKGLGVEHVVQPEQDMGIRIAQAMNYPMVQHYMPLGSDYFLIKIIIKHTLKHTLQDLQHKYPECRFMAVRRERELISPLSNDFHFLPEDRLLVIGELDTLKTLALEFA